jgi:hypothetical protein
MTKAGRGMKSAFAESHSSWTDLKALSEAVQHLKAFFGRLVTPATRNMFEMMMFLFLQEAFP